MHHAVSPPEPVDLPVPLMADGRVRKVAVEVEFLGPSPAAAAQILAGSLGGRSEREDPHAYKVRATPLGDIAIETDLRLLHPARHPELAPRLGPWGTALLGHLTSTFVPRELITAPMPPNDLGRVDTALVVLRSSGARGRGAVLLDSLGLHFNIDPPSLDAETLTAYMRAFLHLGVDLRRRTARGSRRLALATPPDYPQAYKEKVLAVDYKPTLSEFTADYLAANPTRKRALDLLPLLAYLDEDRVRSALPREKIGRRPVFHYRLPQAHVGEPGWSILPDWRGWLAVERLAFGQQGARRPAGLLV